MSPLTHQGAGNTLRQSFFIDTTTQPAASACFSFLTSTSWLAP